MQLHLQPHVTVQSAIPLLAEAKQLEADRLADACLHVVAQNLHALVNDPDFSDLVRHSAATVENREDVDSVPVIDDLRFFIHQIHGEDVESGGCICQTSCPVTHCRT